MNSTATILPHYTYDDWIHWEGKWELIKGIPHAMSPAPVPKHQQISSNLSIAFGVPLRACNKCSAYQPINYLITNDTILQPDFLIVCGEITKKYLDFPPALVVEILSPATALKDRHTKYDIYESQGIKYYIIIMPDKEEAEIFELMDGKYHLKESGKNFVHEFFFPECNTRVDFKEIW
ncbi:MAG: Uma2 family endonuclease [Niastella sp.]|uniref:Uma2 family endonuclease n=1 Tax=Niastella sp. TaxID=1869183 RepID=UPI00389A9323